MKARSHREVLLDGRHQWVFGPELLDGSIGYTCWVCGKVKRWLPIDELIRRDVAESMARAFDKAVTAMGGNKRGEE